MEGGKKKGKEKGKKKGWGVGKKAVSYGCVFPPDGARTATSSISLTMSRGTACVLWHTVDSSQHAHSLYVRLMSTGRGRVQLSWSRGALRCSFALLTFSFKNPRVLIRCCIAAVTDRPAIVLAVGGKREVRPACFRWSLGGRGGKSPLETESSGLEEQSEQACKRADRICKQSRTAE